MGRVLGSQSASVRTRSARLSAVIWVLAIAAAAIVLGLFARMLGRIGADIPAGQLYRWRNVDLGLSDGSDTLTYWVFFGCWLGLLFLDWPVAMPWLAVVAAGVELFRRRHNRGQPVE